MDFPVLLLGKEVSISIVRKAHEKMKSSDRSVQQYVMDFFSRIETGLLSGQLLLKKCNILGGIATESQYDVVFG